MINDIFLLEDDFIRILIFLEILVRSRNEFIKFIKKIFSETWEFKILEAFLKHSPMNKSKLSFVLFHAKGRHYKLSRSNPVYNAFKRLLTNKIIVEEGNLYDINADYKLILRKLFLD
jgi:hypothetical protein